MILPILARAKPGNGVDRAADKPGGCDVPIAQRGVAGSRGEGGIVNPEVIRPASWPPSTMDRATLAKVPFALYSNCGGPERASALELPWRRSRSIRMHSERRLPCCSGWARLKSSSSGLPPGIACFQARTSTWQSAGCHHPFTSRQSARLPTSSADRLTSWIWTIRHRLSDIFLAAGNWSVSRELTAKIRVGLEEFAIVRQQFEPLIAISSDATVGAIETSAASAMLHSFYTEIEKILKLIAREWDQQLPSSDSWHKDLLLQMSQSTANRPSVLSSSLVEVLNEFLAFRTSFEGLPSPSCGGTNYIRS